MHLLLKYIFFLFAPSATTASATQRCKSMMQTPHYVYPGYPWYDSFGQPQEGYWYDTLGQVWQPSKYTNLVYQPGIGTNSSSQCAWQSSMASGQPAPQMAPSQPQYTRDGLQTDIRQPPDGGTSSSSSCHAPSPSNPSRSRAKKHTSQKGQDQRKRKKSRAKEVKTGVRTESQEGHGQEGQEGERRRRKKSRVKELTNKKAKKAKKGTTITQAEEPDEPGPLVIFVSAGTGEKKKTIQKRLEVAWNAKPGALIFTLDRDTITRERGTRTTEKYVKELLEIGKKLPVNDGANLDQHIFSNEAGANIAVCWDMNSLLCDQFMACDSYTAPPTEPTSHTLLFKMTIPRKQEVVHCAIMQIEHTTVKPYQVIRDVWNKLPMPCLIGGNLLCPRIWHGKDLRNGSDLKHGHDPGKERYFQAYDAVSAVWPQPFFIAALGAQMHAAQKPTELNQQSTLVTQLYLGSVSEQEAAPQEDLELESDEDIPQEAAPQEEAAPHEELGGALVESWAAFALGIMGCCCGDQGLSETKTQYLEEIAQGEAKRILDLEDGPPGRSQEICKEIRNLERRIGWTKEGAPRSFWPRLSWWVKCDLCKQYVREMHTTRHYEEPLHDVLTKCNTYLARENWSVGKRSGVRWTISDDDRYPHLKMCWANRDDKRRFKAFVRQDIGHKDIPYFIWTHGLPGCLQQETTTTADLDGYTKDLVHWLWKLAKYIVVTKQEIGHRMKRMRRQADNAAMIRRLWNSL